MKRILYLMPAPVSRGPMGPGELQRRRALLQHRASIQFEWEVGETDEGPPTIESLEDEELCIPGTIRAALAAERDGFSAIILGCFADPGLELARSVLRIPVVGPAESALRLACTLGRSYTILTTSDAVIPLMHKVVARSGSETRLASVRTLGSTVLEVGHDQQRMLEQLASAGEAALSEDGSSVLVLGCMSLAFLNVAPKLERVLGAPVVCPLTAAVVSAESALSPYSKPSPRSALRRTSA